MNRLDRQNVQITPENISMYIRYIFTYIGLYIQVRVIISLHYLSYIYNKYLSNVQLLFLIISSKLSVRLANITLGKLKPK